MGRPPELLNSDEQLIGMGREIAPERRGLRTRAERGSRGAFYRAQRGPNFEQMKDYNCGVSVSL